MKAKTKNISIVLYKPKYAGNVGSVARAAKNMGIRNIVVVGETGLDREEMERRSTHLAADVLDQIRYCDAIEEALGGFHYIVGTTARLGKARGPFVSPRAEALKIAGLSQKNQIALLFGPEDTGLANEQLRLCHSVVTIPTSREFSSLNLSQAAMILCYETDSYTHLRAHETVLELVCRLLLEKKKNSTSGKPPQLQTRSKPYKPRNNTYTHTSIQHIYLQQYQTQT